ncbi:hypothetical protein DFJ58DRAFT_822887 [Suillus subalutaceus]|uniref:uncharacterized protein n=1 Tax=Suillus subalutaceus TaxID=48586 RepID=UPI001B87CB1A|nr:uncharacterized protein DFJ58DRAFT_822887 [Suillus subalutaceus]KAG1832622.1 hypothetical protein DFJ58DRAFT_822887 [Suillus subalutaceus]
MQTHAPCMNSAFPSHLLLGLYLLGTYTSQFNKTLFSQWNHSRSKTRSIRVILCPTYIGVSVDDTEGDVCKSGALLTMTTCMKQRPTRNASKSLMHRMILRPSS